MQEEKLALLIIATRRIFQAFQDELSENSSTGAKLAVNKTEISFQRIF